MKIAFLTHFSHKSGTYFRWHNLALALIHSGHEVDIYAGDHDYKTSLRQESRDGINYYIIPSLMSRRVLYNPNDIFSGLRMLFNLPEKEYQVYHLFQPFLQAYIPWKFLKWQKKHAVFIYDWDDLWTNGLFGKANNIREKYLLKVTEVLEKRIPSTSDGVTVCSEFLRNSLPTITSVMNIGNGFWPAAIPQKEAMRSKWNLSSDIFYLAYIGKTAGELDWIIDALTEVSKSRFNVRLLIAGPPQSQIEQFTSEQLAKIDYMGSLTPPEAREIAVAADLGLIPLDNSLFNQSRFPIKFFDFLTVNTPVYMSDVGEIALIGKRLRHAVVGSSQREEWIQGLPDAVNLIEKGRLGEVNLDIINAYSWPELALQLTRFYSETITRKNLSSKIKS